jgi:hypothetical protein
VISHHIEISDTKNQSCEDHFAGGIYKKLQIVEEPIEIVLKCSGINPVEVVVAKNGP